MVLTYVKTDVNNSGLSIMNHRFHGWKRLITSQTDAVMRGITGVDEIPRYFTDWIVGLSYCRMCMRLRDTNSSTDTVDLSCVYTVQPVVKPAVAGCLPCRHSSSRLYKWLYNDLYHVNILQKTRSETLLFRFTLGQLVNVHGCMLKLHREAEKGTDFLLCASF